MNRVAAALTSCALATLLAGCQPFGPVTPSGERPSVRPSTAGTTAKPSTTTTPATGPGPVIRIKGTVRWVLDGDTFDLLDGKRTHRIRMLGIDAPENATEQTKAQCGAATAKKALQMLLPAGTSVVVDIDLKADDHDRFGRTLGYVSRTGLADAGLRLLKDGMVGAWAPKSSPTPSRMSAYRAAATKAKQARQGLWKTCTTLGR